MNSSDNVAIISNALILLLRAIARSLFIVIVLIALLNLLPNKVELIFEWIDKNYIYFIAASAAITLIYINKILPTARTLFRLNQRANISSAKDRMKGYDRLCTITIIAAMLYIVANFPYFEPWYILSFYPERYLYAAYAFTYLAIIGIIARLQMPKKPVINKGAFAPDQPDQAIRPTETQLQAISHLSSMFIQGVPRSISLSGEWGSGKTKVYKDAQSRASDVKNEIIWVDFNPWQYASEEALVKGFYETIANNIDTVVPGIQNTLVKVTKSVEQLISKTDNGSFFQVITSFLHDIAPSSETPDEIIKGILRREGKRLVITLDDIERQYGAERTYRALQLVHHAKSMGSDNVQVLTIFEHEALLKAAPPHIPSPQEYLEKFSEIEIALPPPTMSSLRKQLEELIDNQAYRHKLPSNFELNLSNSSIRDIKSHRGIIRAFNELLLEFLNTENRDRRLTFQESSGNDENVTYVDFTDRFLMGHIKLKYPNIYSDIARNRRFYTTSKEGELDIQEQFMDDKQEIEQSKTHFTELFKASKLSGSQTDAIIDLLVDLFPHTGIALKDHNSFINEHELRDNRKIGHRDVLDAFFALTTSQDEYRDTQRRIKALIKDINDTTEAELTNRFTVFMQESSENSAIDEVTLLRNELLNRKHKSYQLRAFRAWLRASLSLKESIDGINVNLLLGRTLSAISEIVGSSQEIERIDAGKYIFERITTYLNDPYDGLLLLLFLLPESSNNILRDYVNNVGFGKNGVYTKVLSWIDRYFERNNINIYSSYSPEEWQIITTQWPMSVSLETNVINSRLSNAKRRYTKAQRYLFAQLLSNDRVAYEYISTRFKTNIDEGENELRTWKINGNLLSPFTANQLIEIVQKLRRSLEFTNLERSEIESFLDEITYFRKKVGNGGYKVVAEKVDL